ncbi:MAG: hypothetical protein NC930_03025 [Candidatus Omnitrophica bacterium]|nr:hypothetical protein [Candidatus Omnitrophota bacterium]
MLNELEPYWNFILQGRSWSWSLVGIIYLMAGLIIRGWFLKPLVAQTKEMGGVIWHDIKKAYLKYSLLGWILFFIPFAIVVTLWYLDKKPPITFTDIALLVTGVVSFILSIIFHLQAFGFAMISVLKNVINKESGKIF